MTSSSSSSSSRTWRYDVFPSFSGEDVRKYFLSHLLKELHRKLIITFIDNSIKRGHLIGPELLSAIRESRISIVVFSRNYASSTWCLNELVEIHKSYEECGQMVIPVFYNVDPSEVRKQTGEFGKAFEETCKGKPKDLRDKWIKALEEVSKMAGEDFRNWSNETDMVEKIANYVSSKIITPSNGFGDFVGIEAHIEALISLLCFDSKEARMIGIVGPPGIGKTTIGRALYGRLTSQFHHRAFVAYRRTKQSDYDMKLFWEEQFLSEILCQKDIKIEHIGAVEQRLKHKKVLVFLDDVDDIELLKTLAGHRGWFGSESRVVVISRDRKLVKSHKIDHVYEVGFPSEEVALHMFCRSAFGQNSPPRGFEMLAVEAANLACKLPLRLNNLGSSFRGMDRDEWVEKLSKLHNGLDGKTENTLKVSHNELAVKDQSVSRLYTASLANGEGINSKNLHGQCSNSQSQRNMDATSNGFSKDSSQVSTPVVNASPVEEEKIQCKPAVHITSTPTQQNSPRPRVSPPAFRPRSDMQWAVTKHWAIHNLQHQKR